MPRLTPVLSNGRKSPLLKFINYAKRTAIYKVPLPPILSDSVSNKQEKNKKVECLQEMTLMMTCWKDKDFSQERCSKEIEAFDKCAAASNAAMAKKKEMEKKGIFSPVQGRLPSKQVNKLLSRYPQPPHKYS